MKERRMVPSAEFRSYYGRPVVKAPVWRHDIAAYLFTGGLAAGSALLAAGADLTGRRGLRRAGRVAALGALGASTYFLINDLGRPERFHHMLRVVKPTSPMSMGSWILTAFGSAAGVAAASELVPRGFVGTAGRAAGLAAAALAPPLATYTAVLLADTATPSWHEAYPELPFIFAGSALASGAALLILTARPARTEPAAVPAGDADRGTLVQLCIYLRDRLTSTALATRLDQALNQVGVSTVEPTGERFDPSHHEAGGTLPTTDSKLVGTIATVEAPGYADRGVLLRPPVVTVYQRRQA